jgi:FkbM family methyltransferase
MNHHPVFEAFQRAKVVASGKHVYDFLGGATDTAFKKGWAQHAPSAGAELMPGYPPVNEHYFDWIATLESLRAASGVFRMAELGAGWAPWLVRAALGSQQCPAITGVELVAVEADATHFKWVQQHFQENGLSSPNFHIMYGGMAGQRGTIRFPVVHNPAEDYGASTRAVTSGREYVEVPAYSMADVLARFDGPVDLVHVDIQGAEYDVLPPAMPLLKSTVRAIMVGTHLSTEHHEGLVQKFREEGWREIMNFPRNGMAKTDFGDVQFGDGFLYYRNPWLAA